MFFTIKKELLGSNTALNKYNAINSARRRILLYKQGSNEIALDKYLTKEYNLNLKLMCLRILNNCQWNTNDDGDIIVVFPNKSIDNMASLITYGTGIVQGSNILAFAFHRLD